MNAKKAIRKAFKFQIDKTCFSLIEVVSTCPTGWGQQPHEACEWLRNTCSVLPAGRREDAGGGALTPARRAPCTTN